MGAKKQNGAKSSLGENGLRLLAGDTEALRAEKGGGGRWRRREWTTGGSGGRVARTDFRDLADV